MNGILKQKLVLFTRYPDKGKCKTRLIPFIGEENSAEIQKRMTNIVKEVCKDFMYACKCHFEIHFDGGDYSEMKAMFGKMNYSRQSQGDIGKKMYDSFSGSFDEGFEKTVIIGSDCVDISSDLIKKAFFELENSDIVLGPAKDGGYYLIGMKKPKRSLFTDNIRWGSSGVLSKTLKIAKKENLSVFLLEELNDIDEISDLIDCFKTDLVKNLPKPIISIIIPTLNEEKEILKTINSAKSDNVEMLICDGGSTDKTLDICKNAGLKVIKCKKGRAFQQNSGADVAESNILMFLHADTLLPENYLVEVLFLLAKENVAGGAFRFDMNHEYRFRKIVRALANLRSSSFKMPYGDQALFMMKNTFQSVGRFPEIPIMEDYALVKKLKKKGKIILSQKSVITSARRWIKNGYLKTTFINQIMILGYHLGISYEKLQKTYKLL